MTVSTKNAAYAASLEIENVAQNDNGTHTATKGKASFVGTSERKAIAHCALAWKLIEYPGIEVAEGSTEWEGKVLVEFRADRLDVEAVFAETLEQAVEAGYEESTNEEGTDEESKGGSVVHPKYRALYRQNESKGRHNGDWLAFQLDNRFEKVVDGKISLDADTFFAMLEANGVTIAGKWTQMDRDAKGWAGRTRMCGRVLLEKVLARTGQLVLGAEVVPLPEDFLLALRAKHPTKEETLAKRKLAKLAKAA